MSSIAIPHFTPARARSYILRVPVCTRIIGGAIVLFWALSWSNGFRNWGWLEPEKVFAGGAHRMTTYAFLHLGFIHLFFNLFSVIPLIDRFESEFGTLATLALFTGPFTTLPALLYTLLSLFVFRTNTPICGASIWAFLLLTSHMTQQARTQPYINLVAYRLPTLSVPLIAIVATHFLVPHTSIVGHLLGSAVGWGWGAGYLKFLMPPEKALRWVETKGDLLRRVPHYVSVDQKTYGRYGILPTANGSAMEMGQSGQRLGP